MRMYDCMYCKQSFQSLTKLTEHLLAPSVLKRDHRKAFTAVIFPMVDEIGWKGIVEDKNLNKDLIESLLVFADFNPPEHDWEREYKVKAGDIYVEAGGYHARYARKLIKKLKDNVQIFLVEPSIVNTQVIKAYIERENLKNVILVEKAIGSHRRTDWFVLTKNIEGQRLIKGEKDDQEEESLIEVEVISLDDLMIDLKIDCIDLFACDIEGAELEMMKGMKISLKEKRIKNLAIGAYHTAECYTEVISVLKEYGYKTKLVHFGMVYAHV